MKTDFGELQTHAAALYELLRDSEDREVRSHLRKLIYHMEMINEASMAVPQSARTLANWLMLFCDVEHGVFIKHYPDDPNDVDRICIEQHVKERQKQLHAGMALHAEVEQGVKHLAGMLGVSGAQAVPVVERIAWFAKVLLEHLRSDREMGEQLHSLALATMESLRSVQEMLVDIGEESPELQRVELLLSHPIPSDPVEARNYLERVSHDLKHVQHKMTEDSTRMRSDIDDRVQAFDDVSSKLSAIQDQARSDALTGLPNKRALIDFLEEHAKDPVISMAIMDIDQLQKINDLAGDAGGDRCLCEIADLLIGRVRADDMVFRIGGDVFLMVFPGIGVKGASKATQALHDSIEQMSLSLSGKDVDVRTSFGLAERAERETLHSWMKRADAALYVAKGRGGNCVEAS